MRTPALAGLAILAAAAPALAADRPVGKGRRYPTIQSAVDAAEPGDRIVVGKGVYRESVWFGGKDGLTFVGRGAVWDGRISRGNTASCLEFDASGVTVEGFTFRNGVFHVRGFGTANVVRRCVARNADTYSVGLEGSDAVVESCRISGSGDAAIQVRGERGTVKSSRCSNVAATAIRVEGGAARIAGNTVLTVREGAGVSVNGSHAEVTDNRLSGFGWGAIVIYGDDVAVRRNVCASTSEWEAALQVEGQRVLVEDNRVTAAGGFGVMVSGDAMTVRRNRVSDSTRPAAGFRLQSATESGGGRVEDNVAVRTGHVGFDVALRNASVRRCVAVDCGRSARARRSGSRGAGPTSRTAASRARSRPGSRSGARASSSRGAACGTRRGTGSRSARPTFACSTAKPSGAAARGSTTARRGPCSTAARSSGTASTWRATPRTGRRSPTRSGWRPTTRGSRAARTRSPSATTDRGTEDPMRHVCWIGVLLAAASPALARDLQVGPGRAWERIGDAVAAARSGDRIVVAPGVYNESVSTDVSGLTFLARGAVVWDAATSGKPVVPLGGCLSVTADDLVVQGFRFRGGAVHVLVDGANARIRNCTSDGAQLGAFGVRGYGARIEGSTVRGAVGAAVQIDGSHALVARNRFAGVRGTAVAVVGDAAVVRGNTVTGTEEGGGIDVSGDDATVASNTLTNVDGVGVVVRGDGASLRSNRVTRVRGAGLAAIGDVAHVERNTVLDALGAGLYVVADSMTVVGNRVERVVGMNIVAGVFLAQYGESGGGRAERNTVRDAAGSGFLLQSRNLRFGGNRALRCGTRSEAAVVVLGAETTLTGCLASGGGATGFEIRGDGDTLVRCTSSANDGDGFRAVGEGATLTDCVATGNAAHGIVNLGLVTSLLRGRFTGNGQDVAAWRGGHLGRLRGPGLRDRGKYELNLYD